MSTSFEKGENAAKFDAGPTPPRPGPMLLMVAATAVKFVIRSLFSKDSAITYATNTSIKVAIYALTERVTSLSTGRESMVIFLTWRG